jgi:hypothetical protein
MTTLLHRLFLKTTWPGLMVSVMLAIFCVITKISLGQQKITKDDLINGYTYAKAMAAKLLGSKNASGILFADSPNNNLQYNSRVNPRKLRLHQHGLRRPWRLPLLL